MWRSIRRKLAAIYEIAEGPNRIQSIEGVRGFAVLLVFCAHYHVFFGSKLLPQSISFTISHFLGTIGHSGVDLFFVLSGYLIYSRLLWKPVGYWKFWRRRVQRIYPTFLCVFVLYVLLGLLLRYRTEMAGGAFATGIYLLQNAALMPGLFEITPLITVA